MFLFENRALHVCTVLLLLVAIFPAVAFGAIMPKQIVPENCSGPNAATACGVCDFATLAQNILNTAIFLAIFLCAVLFAWAGFKYLTAGGDSGQAGAARKIFLQVAVGLIIILGGWLLIDTLMYTLTGSHLWNKIC